MIDYLKDLWSRFTVHWHVVLVAFITALPSILDWLGYIDIRPLLIHFGASDAVASFIVNALPFVLAFLRPMLAVTPPEE